LRRPRPLHRSALRWIIDVKGSTRYRLRTPDAIHLATALHQGADIFLTNDHALLQVNEVPVLLIDELR
jgi:predicted nucleic acid-binding protein